MTRPTHPLTAMLAALLVLATAAPAALQAQEQPAPEATTTRQEDGSPFGVGFQASWPAWGLSGIYDVNDRLTAQAVVGLFGALSNLSARGLYRFSQEDAYDLYGFGTVGLWRARTTVPVLDGFSVRAERRTENVLGFGAGGGIELNWQRLISREDGSFPPLFSTLELGLVLANFDYYNFSGFMIGGGIHYRF